MSPKEKTYLPEISTWIENGWKGKAGAKALGVNGFARVTGISPALVTRYRQGKIGEPTTATLQKLAAYFDVPVSFLRGDESVGWPDKTPLNTVMWLWGEVAEGDGIKEKGIAELSAATGVAVDDIERHLVGRGMPTDKVFAKFAEYSGKDPHWFKGMRFTRNIAGVGPDHETLVEDTDYFVSFDWVLRGVVKPGLKLALGKDVSGDERFFDMLYRLALIVWMSPIGSESKTLSDAEVLEVWRDAGAFLKKYKKEIEQKKQS